MTKINPVTINNGLTLPQIMILILEFGMVFSLGYFCRTAIERYINPPPLLVCPPDFFHPKGRLPR